MVVEPVDWKPHRSVAATVNVYVPAGKFVTMATHRPDVTSHSLVVPCENVTFAMPLASLASAAMVKVAGAINAAPFVGAMMFTTGGVVSTTVIVWLHCDELPQASVARQVRVAEKVLPHAGLVTVLRTVTVALPQVSLAVGVPKVHAVPISTVAAAGQVIVGAVVSTTVTVCEHCALLPQASVAFQVRLAVNALPQVAFVTVETIVIVLLPPASVAVGASNVQALPHSTDLSAWQEIT